MSQRHQKSFIVVRMLRYFYEILNIKYLMFLIVISTVLIMAGVEIHNLNQFNSIDRFSEYLATQDRLDDEINAIRPELLSLQKVCQERSKCTPERKLALNTLLTKTEILQTQKSIPYFPTSILNASLVDFTNTYPRADSDIYNAWVKQSQEQGGKTRYVQIQIFKILMALFLFIYLMKLFRKYLS